MNYKLLLLFVAALSFQSCKTSFRISVKEPAVVQLPENVSNFGVINSIDNTNSPDKLIGDILSGNQINGNVVASEEAVNGILRGIENGQTLTAKVIEREDVVDADNNLDWDKIDSVAKAENIDGIIELLEIKSTSNIGGAIGAASNNTRSYLDGTLYTTVHLIDTTLAFERLWVRRRYNIPSTGSTNIMDVLSDMKRKREYYGKLGFNLGYDAGELLYPNWVWVGRKYYTKGSKAIKRAKPMLKNGNWSLAIKQLSYDEDHHKEKIRGRVLFNLALAHEGLGELDKAIELAERSALECGNKLASEYLVQLRNRKYQMSKI